MSENCNICYIELEVNNSAKTPCDHFFCSKCLFRWLLTNNSCPMCRRKLMNSNVLEEDLTLYSQDILNVLGKGEELAEKNLGLINELKTLKKKKDTIMDEIKIAEEVEKRQIILLKRLFDRADDSIHLEKKLNKQIKNLKIKRINLKRKNLKLSSRLNI